jgi:hypothetical protein
MKEKIAVIPTVITKGSWKGMIMAGMRPKNIIKKYSKESLEKLSKCTGWGDDLSAAMRIVKHRKNPPQFC